MRIELKPDGPHDDDSAIEVANALAECVRVLNHATLPTAGVRYPATVYTLMGALSQSVHRMGQLMANCAGLLADMDSAGELRDVADDDSAGAVLFFRGDARDAVAALSEAARRLDACQQATANLAYAGPDEKEAA